ncbi:MULTISPECIES: TRAP transporter small permease [Marinobacter]|jgi:TRAP-type C4-dicarboxylate transport system permease small subunit|uniref:TRAP transporter small permease protein n=1 Tax=Marinobacter vinifirmus TaxID=355591 RepID=A0A7Z1DVY9_9GAMM|nr:MULTISPECIES: TRAP transporter small permease [Marinobacter]KRW81529.1 C4-dicarboxylate ABC transporter permease [Marinobacter sp. P4B1]OZC36978.1 C4-dicarboxylate ABC transporter permease [Marinobacter vinifirmus]HBM49070.1 TRAP transporter small permease [Marinobacter sp.]|tara:strand:- start:5682 stop:6278 length:597 start_codon:yes stop_codon:yes gene_type:complete
MSERPQEAVEDDTGAYASGLPGFLGTIDEWIARIEAVMLAGGVILMAVNTCVNVIARFVFGEGLFFSGEINRILIILITFAGIGYAARHGRHIRMSAVYDAFPAKGRKALMIFIALFTSVVMFFLCYHSYGYIETLYGRGRILPALGLPIWWIYVWVPVGFAITGIQYFLTAIKNLTSKDVYLSTGVVDGYADTETEV